MTSRLRALGLWWLAWLALSVAGAAWIARNGLAQLQEDFDTQARIAHRLLSQQVVQYDAVLATLALLGSTDDERRGAEQRLGAVYPSIRAVARRDPGATWPDARLAAAEAQSASAQRPQLGPVDLAAGRYWLVMTARPVSYALDVDLARAVPWADWPMDAQTSPVRLTLQDNAGQQFVVQPGAAGSDGAWRFEFRKHLASASQSFDVVAERRVRLVELPWGLMLGWALAVGLLLAAGHAWLRQRGERRLAEERVRFAQVSRLNALGELAAGMAHELNQPLTAVLANVQAARRLLDDDAATPEERASARTAMGQAVDQARRAAEVVGRLRRAIERPGSASRSQVLAPQDVLRRALDLLQPELARQGVEVAVAPAASGAAPLRVQGDPVAVEQIVHNLLVNAMQALAPRARHERRIEVSCAAVEGGQCEIRVRDNGPGIAPEVLPRIFEPFFSTREHGLGLGLSLCETLAQEMGGSLSAAAAEPAGACFTLRLPRPAATAA